jgi:alpha-D-xyloside xylohydrolase
MRIAHEKGTPMMRPLFYDFPGDLACWDVSDQYMFGPDYLVAPIVYPGARERAVYLPAGSAWTHMFSGIRYDGGAAVRIDAPLDEIPVFARDGRQEHLVVKI